jgi:hypothetical protein
LITAARTEGRSGSAGAIARNWEDAVVDLYSDKPLILLWIWRHHSLDVDIMESLEKAARAAHSAVEYETGAPECAEVVEPNGATRRLDPEELATHLPPPTPAPERPPVVAEVRIMSPEQSGWGGKREPVVYDVYPSLAEAEAAADELRPWLGDRVTARIIGA